MDTVFEKQSFGKRLKSMLKTDFRRMYTMPLVYIMAGVCFLLPVLMLVMTSLMGEEAAAFTNVWQSVGAPSGSGMTMDLTGMCNINLLYFLAVIFVCVFVADDFKSGYAKNLFTVRAKKSDYIISKTLAMYSGCVIMIIAYLIGAMIGGAIAGLPFDAGEAGAGGIAMCILSKTFMAAVFVGIAILLATVAKQHLWLSILCSLAAGMLLFTMIPIAAPLDANALNLIMCLVGGGAFAAGLGAFGGLVLNKTSIA